MESSYWRNYWNRRLGRRAVLVGGATSALGVGAILAGCGDDDDSSEGASPTPGGGTASSTAVATAQPQRGGTLRLAKSGKDSGLDPAGRVVNQIWEQSKVYSWTHAFQLSTGEIQLDVAASYETPDTSKIIFKFRDGVNFQPHVAGGRQLVAEDYKFSFDRVADFVKTKGGLAVPMMYDWIESIQVPDKLTAIVTQKRSFFERMTAAASRNPFAIVAREMVEANGGALENVTAGSGPYLLTKRDDTGTTLQRWPGYFKRDKDYPGFPKDGPYIETIETRILPDPSAQDTAFLSGQLHLHPQTLPIDSLSIGQYQNKKGVVVQKIQALPNQSICWDMPKWTDLRARQAIMRAIDWDLYNSTLLAGDGRFQGHVSGAFADIALPEKELRETVHKFDPKSAKELWSAAGNPMGGKLRTMSYPGKPGTITEFVKSQLEKNLGVQVEHKSLDVATYVAKAQAPRPKEWDFFVAGLANGFEIPGEGNALQHATPNGYGPLWGFAANAPDPATAAAATKTMELYEKAQSAPDKAARKTAIQALDRFLLEGLWSVVPLPVARTQYVLYSDTLMDFPAADNSTAYPARDNRIWLKG